MVGAASPTIEVEMTDKEFFGTVEFSVSAGIVPWGDPGEYVHTVAGKVLDPALRNRRFDVDPVVGDKYHCRERWTAEWTAKRCPEVTPDGTPWHELAGSGDPRRTVRNVFESTPDSR